MICDLCSKDESIEGSLLCQSCGESISRLITIKQWESNRKTDKLANEVQASMLRKAILTSNDFRVRT